MPDRTLDYHSLDLGAVAPDETLIWSGESAPPRTGCASAAKLMLFAVVACPAIIIAVWAMAPARTAGPATAIVVAIGFGIVALSVVDVFRRRSFTPKQACFTDRRLIVTGRTPAELQQLSHDQLRSFRGVITTRPGLFAADDASASVEVAIDEDDLDDAEVESIPLRIDDPKLRQQLLAQMATAGVAARTAKRRWRRAWRPAKIEPLTLPAAHPFSSPPIVSAPELLPGEIVLWSGAPALRWKADLRHRLLEIGRSSFWILAAAGVVTLVFLSRESVGGGLISLGVIAGLFLFAQFIGHIWTPFFSRRELRRTSYTLTNCRIIVAIARWNGTRIVSTFFDDETNLSLEVRDDGRGTLTIGLHHRVELIDQAAAVYSLALRAIAGRREGSTDNRSSSTVIDPDGASPRAGGNAPS